ncbi:MAG: hypothetical protein HYS22_02285 [Deltaproteobacteria bacterium]|nr:hypothetical protein [Deltaproteobacteria bacterium]
MKSLLQQLEQIEKWGAFYEASDNRVLEVSGSDSTPFLHRMLSQNIQKQEIGQFLHSALLDRKGMLLSLFGVLKIRPDGYLFLIQQSLFQKTWDHLKKFKVMDKVDFVDRSCEYRLLYQVGSGTETVKPSDSYSWKETIYLKPVVGYLIPSPEIDRFKRNGPSISKEAFDLVRMESGIPEYGVDIDETAIVLEGNLHFAVARNKGCYPGQEVVERIFSYGKGRTPKNLCLLTVDEEVQIPAGTIVYDAEGKEAGKVTSARWHPLKKKLLVLAYLDHKFLKGELAFKIPPLCQKSLHLAPFPGNPRN